MTRIALLPLESAHLLDDINGWFHFLELPAFGLIGGAAVGTKHKASKGTFSGRQSAPGLLRSWDQQPAEASNGSAWFGESARGCVDDKVELAYLYLYVVFLNGTVTARSIQY